jgi:hypothetical protein
MFPSHNCGQFLGNDDDLLDVCFFLLSAAISTSDYYRLLYYSLLFFVPCNMSLCKNNFNNIGLRLLNHLPQYIKVIPVLHKFKNTLKIFLLDHCFIVYTSFSCLGINLSPDQL